MHIRPATRSDLADIATVASRAMMDDEISLWLMPDQKQNPALHRQRCLQTNIRRFNNGLYPVVAVLDEQDKEWAGTPEIIGYASYEKEIGASDDSSKRKQSLLLTLERWLYSIEDNYLWYFRNYLGTNKTRIKLLVNELGTNELGKKYPRSWELDLLVVDPAFWRRGVGAELVSWGKARAREDNVPLWLWSSVKGYNLYKRQGFQEFGSVNFGYGKDPAPAMVWMPDSPQ